MAQGQRKLRAVLYTFQGQVSSPGRLYIYCNVMIKNAVLRVNKD